MDAFEDCIPLRSEELRKICGYSEAFRCCFYWFLCLISPTPFHYRCEISGNARESEEGYADDEADDNG